MDDEKEQLKTVTNLLRTSGLDDAQISQWLATPREMFSDRSPTQVINDGDGPALVDAIFVNALGGM